MKKLLTLTLALAMSIAFGACSDPEAVDQTVTGELSDSDPRVPDDDSAYDEYTFDAASGWTITADLTSTDFDTFLWLIGPDGTAIIQDDDGGEGSNSRVAHTTTSGGTYTLRANSYDGTGRGAYSLHYTASPGN